VDSSNSENRSKFNYERTSPRDEVCSSLLSLFLGPFLGELWGKISRLKKNSRALGDVQGGGSSAFFTAW